MAIVNLDFNLEDVSSTIEPVPEDNYVCEIEKAELTTASTGNYMTTWCFPLTGKSSNIVNWPTLNPANN